MDMIQSVTKILATNPSTRYKTQTVIYTLEVWCLNSVTIRDRHNLFSLLLMLSFFWPLYSFALSRLLDRRSSLAFSFFPMTLLSYFFSQPFFFLLSPKMTAMVNGSIVTNSHFNLQLFTHEWSSKIVHYTFRLFNIRLYIII